MRDLLMHSPRPAGKYRPEIDGLRAIAVVAVIINHFNDKVLASGFLGVDIFFVISGYVITSSLSTKRHQRFVDFWLSFCERRIRRLLPALISFVVIASVFVCFVDPEPNTSLQTGVRSLFGLSNISLFRSSVDYFAQSTKLNFFTHTWSLGVEEQFYLLFPFLFWFTGFGTYKDSGRKRFFILTAILAFVSLASFMLLYRHHPAAAYFLMPSRFWEMAAGSLAFIAIGKHSRKSRSSAERISSLALFFGLVLALFLPLDLAPFATLVVVALTVCLIAVLRPGLSTFSFLTLPVISYIGAISYSLYLWHWGVLSLSHWTIGISWWSWPIQVSLIFGLAILSYHWVETPFRKPITFIGSKQLAIAIFGTAVSSAMVISALVNTTLPKRLLLSNDSNGRFHKDREDQVNYTGQVTSRLNRNCMSVAKQLNAKLIAESIPKCLWKSPGSSEGSPIVAFIGDSHAHQLFPIAEELAREYKISVYNFSYSGCLVPQDAKKLQYSFCAAVNSVPSWIDELFEQPVIFVVASIMDPYLHFVEPSAQRELAKSYQLAFSSVLSRNNYLIVVAPNPKFMTIDKLASDICWRSQLTRFNPVCIQNHTFNADNQRKVRTPYLARLGEWSSHSKRVAIVNPYEILCGETNGNCNSTFEGKSKYLDASHLNVQAALSTYSLYKDALQSLLGRKPAKQK